MLEWRSPLLLGSPIRAQGDRLAARVLHSSLSAYSGFLALQRHVEGEIAGPRREGSHRLGAPSA
eukprot:CAMPEP_0184401956 /NCGR_PEP_ID=MMETSP0007-20130409/81059_1 /TAXON_ID=97485 /ORGANISM="Prymnesium parvum, Strain Texoma1" /LENGTH=63 /DNA_ID=CAMNT_0026757555 /DNA_START=21 /DNA_END=215 /DNA_ORIENTATION=+